MPANMVAPGGEAEVPLPAKAKKSKTPGEKRTLTGGDGLRLAYTAMADDAGNADKKREAAMLFSAAEKHLDKEETDECVRVGGDALALFEAMGDGAKVEVADTLRLIISGHRLKSELSGSPNDDAETMADEKLKSFKTAGDKRGEASMLLAVAENKLIRKYGNKDKYDQALEHASEAVKIIQELEDKKLESIALFISSRVHLSLYSMEEATKQAEASAALCVEIGDKLGQGKATHIIAVVLMMTGRLQKGVDKAKEALQMFKDSGNKVWESSEMLLIADFLNYAEQAKKALPIAEEGLSLVGEIECPKDWPAIGLLIVCEQLIETKQTKSVLKRAKEALTKWEQEGSKRSQAVAHQILTLAHLKNEAPEKALKALEDERALVQELGDKSWEASLQHAEAAICVENKDTDGAVEAMTKAVEIAQEAEDPHEERLAHWQISDIRNNNGAYKEALTAAKAARDLSQSTYDKFSEAMDCMQIAFAHSGLGDPAKALSSANEAQEIFQEISDIRGEGYALAVIADLKMAEKKSDAAFEAAEERLTLMRDIADPKLEASALHQIAQLHLSDDNFTEAEKAGKEARGLAAKAGNADLEVDILITLVQAIMSQSQDRSDRNFKSVMEKALKLAAEAVSVAGKADEKFLRGHALYWHGQMLLITEKVQDAMRAVNEAITIFTKMGAKQPEAVSHILLAYVHASFGARDKAMDTLDRALGLARACGDAQAEYDAAMAIQKMQPQQQQQQQMMQQVMLPNEGMQQQQEMAAPTPVSVEPAKPKGLDAAFVRKQLMTFVKDVMATDDELELDSPFMEAGMDSLSSVSLMSMVAKEFQMALSPSLVFDFPTVRALEEHLVEESKGA